MWKDGNVSKVAAEQSVSIRKLHEELSQESWADKLKRKLSAIMTEKKPKESSVAGIRRDEVSINKASELYWSSEDSAEFDKAYKLFEEDKLDEAIELLEKVIEQDPLKDQADMSHALLILIYEQQGNSEKMQEHLEIWSNNATKPALPPDLCACIFGYNSCILLPCLKWDLPGLAAQNIRFLPPDCRKLGGLGCKAGFGRYLHR
jgi:tetratricopeptide (TPR) repeat protein